MMQVQKKKKDKRKIFMYPGSNLPISFGTQQKTNKKTTNKNKTLRELEVI